jgi:hypothetical protein
MMSNCTNQTNTAAQASSAGIDLDQLDKELDSILANLARDYRGAARESIYNIRAMVEAARKPAESGGFCSKLESPCGTDPWGWCQSCPKRAAQQAAPAPAAVPQAVEDSPELSFRSIDDGPEFEQLLFAYRDTKFITGQMRDIIAFANDWLHSALKAHVKRIRQLERKLAEATAPAEKPPVLISPDESAKFETWAKADGYDLERADGSNYRFPKGCYLSDATTTAWGIWQARVGLDQVETASSALNACITYVVHGDADFSGMDEALVSYFKEKVLMTRTLPSSLQVAMASGAWKLVPVALTEDMLVAFAEAWYSKKRCIDDCEMDDAYAAMLEVAPTPSFYYDARTGFTAVGDQLVNEMQLYFDANANVSDECADFLERLTDARVADASNNPAQPESGWQGLPPIGERESIIDVCGLPKLMRDILESKGSPASLGKLYDFIDVWGYARFNFGQSIASKQLSGMSSAEPVLLSLNDDGLVAGYLTQGWSFEYEPETRYIGLSHPRGGKQSICEIQNDDKFGYAIAAALNNAVYPTAEDVRPSDTWRVGEFWSSGSPGTKVLMLSRGAEIASHEKHESFIRWVGASGIHARSAKTAD